MTNEQKQQVAEMEQFFANNEAEIITIKGKQYKLRDIKEVHMDRILKQAVPIMKMGENIDNAESNTFSDIQEAYAKYHKYRKNFAKISSLFLLGHNNFLAFFWHPFYWRILRFRFDTTSHFLIFNKVLNNEKLGFFLITYKSLAAIVKMRILMIPQQNI